MAYGSFAISSKALVFCRPCYGGSIRDLPFSLRTPTIGRCGCVGAIAAPRNLVKPRKEESSGKEIRGGRKSKDKTTPWKKLDANEFGIQRSMIPESTTHTYAHITMSPFKIFLFSALLAAAFLASTADFNSDVNVAWGNGRGKILNNGQLLTLTLDKSSGSGFQSKTEYLFGKIDMQIKLVPGNSAGTVTTFYLKSEGSTWDEIDFEFLGNMTGDPYTLHTNVYTQGKGDKEQQFHLWFDPTANFHTYSILWNPQRIILTVDDTPIREFKNSESLGVLFPKSKPMRMYASLWNADDWATRGGLVKTDWSKAPFTASYRNIKVDGCAHSNGRSSCTSTKPTSNWYTQEMDSTSQARLRWVQKNYMIYNYCTDTKRFPQGIPRECATRS